MIENLLAVCDLWRGWLLKRCVPRLTRGHLFFCVAKRKEQKKRRPPVGAPPAAGGPARLALSGGCATRASPSDSARPQPRSSLRCSAPLRGMLKTIGFSPPSHQTPLGFPLALCVVEQHRAQRERGRGLSEGQRPEFRRSPLRTSSAENPVQPGDAADAPSSWVLLLGKTRRSTSPAGETRRISNLLRLSLRQNVE